MLYEASPSIIFKYLLYSRRRLNKYYVLTNSLYLLQNFLSLTKKSLSEEKVHQNWHHRKVIVSKYLEKMAVVWERVKN